MVKSIYRRFKRALKMIILTLLAYHVQVKHWVFGPYFRGLVVQARYLYEHSSLFQDRCNAIDREYALESFSDDTAMHFIHLAKREHWRIRLQIFINAALGREPKPYYR